MDSNKIIDALQKGVDYRLCFEKIDTKEIRTMSAHLIRIFQTNNAGRKIFSNDTIVCYGLDVNAWRDVKINTIIEWYEGYPKGERMGLKAGETHREFKARMIDPHRIFLWCKMV